MDDQDKLVNTEQQNDSSDQEESQIAALKPHLDETVSNSQPESEKETTEPQEAVKEELTPLEHISRIFALSQVDPEQNFEKLFRNFDGKITFVPNYGNDRSFIEYVGKARKSADITPADKILYESYQWAVRDWRFFNKFINLPDWDSRMKLLCTQEIQGPGGQTANDQLMEIILSEPSIFESMSDSQRLFWTRFNSFSDLNPEVTQIMIKYADQFSLPETSAWSNLWDELVELKNDDVLISVIKNPDVYNALPENEQKFWDIYQDLTKLDLQFGATKEIVDIVYKDRRNFFQSPNLNWENILDQLVIKNDVYSAIQISHIPEIMITLSDQSRTLWTLVDTLPDAVGNLVLEQRTEFENFFINGKPTQAFLDICIDKIRVGELGELVTLADRNSFSEEEKPFWDFFAQRFSNATKQFILQHKRHFSEIVIGGKPTERFLEIAIKTSRIDHTVILEALEKIDMTALSEESKVIWNFFRTNRNTDMCSFMILKPKGTYIRDGKIDIESLKTDYMNELIIQPELCTTYESLTEIFNYYHSSMLKGNIYLGIAAAHRKRTIDSRTEVEAIPDLRSAYAKLWNVDMPVYDLLAWKILQRQLPFTANESKRGEMRNQAIVVESFDHQRLKWVHQSVHNYASIHEVPYLKAFQYYLKTGDRSDLDTYRAIHKGISQAPLYTEEDRKILLGMKRLPQEVDKMIDDASAFYEINPEALQKAKMNFTAQIPEAKKVIFTSIYKEAEEFLKRIQDKENLTDDDRAAAIGFVNRSNILREQIRDILRDSDEKEYGLVLDIVLDDLSQKVLTQYKDYIDGHTEKFTREEIFEAISMVGETFIASAYNGEVDQDVVKTAQRLREVRQTGEATKENLHALRLLLPIMKHSGIETHWQRFSDAAKTEMVTMLCRTGMTEEEAQKQVLFTDLVEFRKGMTAYLLDPLLETVEQLWDEIDAPSLEESAPKVYEELLGEQIIDDGGAREIKEISDFITSLQAKGAMPLGIEASNKFLSQLEHSLSGDAEKLARTYVSGYLNKDALERTHVRLEKDGKTIEFYPLSYFGVDLVAILEDGKLVDDPKEYMIKNFHPVPAAMHALREGD